MGASSVISLVLQGKDQASDVFDRVSGKVGGLGSTLSMVGSGAMMLAGAAATAVAGGFVLATKTAIDMNATLETSTLQFTTLMGDADAAEQHVRGLFEFAKQTPFETGPIIEASRMMQTFGGAALNTEENLMLIGDASAAVSAPIEDLGFWTGRLYSQLEAGKPFGEAAMRLQELAVLSPTARNEMEELQKSGASAAEIFAVFEADLGRFSGAMEAQAGTWEGLKSTITDSLAITAATALKPFFDMAKDGLGAVAEFLSDPAFTAGVEMIAEKISLAGYAAGQFVERIREGAPFLDSFQIFVTQIALVFGEAGPAAREMGESVGSFVGQVQAAIQPVADWIGNNVQLSDVLTAVGIAIGTVVIPAIISLVAAAAPIVLTFAAIVGAVALMRMAWENDFGGIQEKTQAAMDFIRNIIITVSTAIQEFWALHGETIMAAATAVWDTITTNLQIVWDNITGIFAAFRLAFEGDWYGFGEQLRVVWDRNWNRIKELLAGFWGKIQPILSALITNAIDKFKNTDWASVGRNIIQGIANGISAAVGVIKDAARAAAQAALDAARGFLGINSPSSVAADQIGKPFAEGIEQGFLTALAKVDQSMVSGLGRTLSGLEVNGQNGSSGAVGNGNGGSGAVYQFAAGSIVIKDESTGRALLAWLQGVQDRDALGAFT